MKRCRRGQATIEYSMIVWVLACALFAGSPFLTEMVRALNLYYRSIYFVIELPLP